MVGCTTYSDHSENKIKPMLILQNSQLFRDSQNYKEFPFPPFSKMADSCYKTSHFMNLTSRNCDVLTTALRRATCCSEIIKMIVMPTAVYRHFTTVLAALDTPSYWLEQDSPGKGRGPHYGDITVVFPYFLTSPCASSHVHRVVFLIHCLQIGVNVQLIHHIVIVLTSNRHQRNYFPFHSTEFTLKLEF